jgi:hypothetical protein
LDVEEKTKIGTVKLWNDLNMTDLSLKITGAFLTQKFGGFLDSTYNDGFKGTVA